MKFDIVKIFFFNIWIEIFSLFEVFRSESEYLCKRKSIVFQNLFGDKLKDSITMREKKQH